MRVVLIVAVAVAVFSLLLLAGAALALDPLIQAKVPQRMSEALDVPVTLGDADASLGGSLRLEELAVANPSGYGNAPAVRIERLSAEVRPLSLLSDVVEVETLRVRRPRVSVEFQGLKSNIQALMDNVPPRDREKGKRFRIGRLILEGATVRFTSDTLPGGARDVTLPALELADVGTAEDAASMGQVAYEVLRTLMREALKHAGELPAELARSLGQAVEEGARDVIKDAKERLEDRLRRGVEELQPRKAD